MSQSAVSNGSRNERIERAGARIEIPGVGPVELAEGVDGAIALRGGAARDLRFDEAARRSSRAYGWAAAAIKSGHDTVRTQRHVQRERGTY